MAVSGWTSKFSGFSMLPQNIRDILHRDGLPRMYKAGEVLFSPGATPDALYFLTEGTVRVFQRSDTGREIVLYRVEAGQSCVLTTACVMAEHTQGAEGVAETNVKAVALPKATFDHLTQISPEFRDMILKAFAVRMVDLMQVIDDVAFGRIDIRIASRLLSLADDQDIVRKTHGELASELGTAREVVTRQLNDFQKREWIKLSRGTISLKDKDRLRALSNLSSTL